MLYEAVTLEMFALSAGDFGVASERSGYESVCESALALAGNRTRAGFSEGSAVPSDDKEAVDHVRKAPRSAAVRNYYKEGKAGMQDKFSAELQISICIAGAIWLACKNVPSRPRAAR